MSLQNASLKALKSTGEHGCVRRRRTSRGGNYWADLVSERIRCAIESKFILSSLLVFAATDTTSSTLSRILNLLAQHTHVQNRLREEIVAARRKGGDLGLDELFALPYLDAVCRETLRLYVQLLPVISLR